MPSLISLDSILLVWAAALAALWRRPAGPGPRHMMLIALAVSVLISVPIVPHAASLALAGHYAPLAADDPRAPLRVIVVLGAGTQVVEGGGRQLALLDAVGAGRVLEAARAYAILDRPWVISSGGARTHRPELSSAAVMKTALIDLGVDPSRILVENRSLTTRDEAVVIAPLLTQLAARRFVLVTSRDHMSRSLGAFRNQGLDPVASAAVDDIVHARWLAVLTPDVAGLRLSQSLVHELLGQVYYRWRGWIS